MNPNPSEPSPSPTISPAIRSPDTPPNLPADTPAVSPKHRSDAKLLNLPADQREELVEWLLDGMSYEEARNNVASNFGLDVRSLNRFSEFWDVLCAPRILERRKQFLNHTRIHAAAAREDAHCLDIATFDAIRQRAYRLACSPASTIDDISRALDLTLRIRKLEYAERKLALAELQRATRDADRADKLASPATTPAQTPSGSSDAVLKQAWALLHGSEAKVPSGLSRHVGSKIAQFSAVPSSPAYLTPSL